MNFEFYKHIELDSEVEIIKNLLKGHDIPYELSSPNALLDSSIVGQGLFARHTLKLRLQDFEKVNRLIRNQIDEKNIDIDDFEHLQALNQDELVDILSNPSEWSIESVIAAKKILQSRDYSISDNEVEVLKNEHFDELQKGKSVSTSLQLLSLFAIILGFFGSVIFTIGGIAMGYYYSYGKKVDSEGQKYFVYNDKARLIGKFIFYLGIILICVQLYFFEMHIFKSLVY